MQGASHPSLGTESQWRPFTTHLASEIPTHEAKSLREKHSSLLSHQTPWNSPKRSEEHIAIGKMEALWLTLGYPFIAQFYTVQYQGYWILLKWSILWFCCPWYQLLLTKSSLNSLLRSYTILWLLLQSVIQAVCQWTMPVSHLVTHISDWLSHYHSAYMQQPSCVSLMLHHNACGIHLTSSHCLTSYCLTPSKDEEGTFSINIVFEQDHPNKFYYSCLINNHVIIYCYSPIVPHLSIKL